jgi:N-glycosylase/DNA lyase
MHIGKFLNPRGMIGQLRARMSRVKVALEVLPVGLVSWRAVDHGLPWNLGMFAPRPFIYDVIKHIAKANDALLPQNTGIRLSTQLRDKRLLLLRKLLKSLSSRLSRVFQKTAGSEIFADRQFDHAKNDLEALATSFWQLRLTTRQRRLTTMPTPFLFL